VTQKGDIQYLTSSTVDQAYVSPRGAFVDYVQVWRSLSKACVMHVALKRDKSIPHHMIRAIRGASGIDLEFHADVIFIENLIIRAGQYHTSGSVGAGRVGALSTWW
jgi:hypothetical protein